MFQEISGMAKKAAKTAAHSTGRGSAHNPDLPLFKFISDQIDKQKLLGITQRDIAHMVGYDQPSMVNMWKAGTVKVPLDKIPQLAVALDCDPAYLFRLALPQFWPGAEKAIADIFGDIYTKNERALVRKVRAMTGGEVPAITAAQERKIKAVLSEE
jgi:transcriptional regulator with XRE-family HTH domain